MQFHIDLNGLGGATLGNDTALPLDCEQSGVFDPMFHCLGELARDEEDLSDVAREVRRQLARGMTADDALGLASKLRERAFQFDRDEELAMLCDLGTSTPSYLPDYVMMASSVLERLAARLPLGGCVRSSEAH